MDKDKEELIYTYTEGYHQGDDNIFVPEGAMIYPSENVIYTRQKKPISLKSPSLVGSGCGGSRMFPLDANLHGIMGLNPTSSRAIGNMVQNVGKSLWFVGNTLNNGVKAFSNYTTPVHIGGTSQVETLTFTARTPSVHADEDVDIIITGAYISGSPVTVTANISDTDTDSQIVAKFLAAILDTDAITDQYWVVQSGLTLVFTDKHIRTNDGTLQAAIQTNTASIATNTSTNTTAASLDYAANLSSTPQFATWNGTGWDNPVQVGLAPQETVPQLELTSDTTRNDYFTGIITGSTSCRLARKRNGTISIASGASNVITGEEDSCYVFIPAYIEDGSSMSDREWILYFTYKGKGSQAAHFMFPITIPESKLNGQEANGWESTQGNAKIKVIEQHATTQANRKVEVEFYDNDLLLLEPFEDYYAAESCKFIAPLGNVMCLIGVGEDSTGFDVSYPNNREAYSPDWRDWFSEVPVSIAHASELGMFWVLTANTVYQAIWTGATQETAPVVLRQVTSKAGAIGEGASVSVNGILYFFSRNGVPVRISPNQEIDGEFGSRVKNAFSSFDDNTQVIYDASTNSVLFICGIRGIAYQIDNDIWTSPINYTPVIAIEPTPEIDAVFSINGYTLFSVFDGAEYDLMSYNTGTDTLNWLACSSFQTGKTGLSLKDIIESRIVCESSNAPYTITVARAKDYVNSYTNMYTFTPSATGVKISTRQLVEELDFESISMKCSGTKGGQTPHAVYVTVDIHEIERGT